MTPGSNTPGSAKQQELEVLLASLVEAGLSADQKARLGELLKDDPEARRFYKRYLEVHAMLEWESGTMVSDETESDEVLQALAELARLHDEGLKQPVRLRMRRKGQPQPQHAGQAAVHRFPRRVLVAGSLAAAIAIAGLTVLVVNLFSQPEATVVEEAPEDRPFVATLTDATDAAWENRAGDTIKLPIDSPMMQGQYLTLTEGFAQITTNRGAVAVLEAPTTIELIDSPNAMRLHAGKLVGICETETSKGFLVRTPHLDVTDLGTRFGVNTSDADSTQVYVIDGEVEVTATATNGLPMPYRKGESVSVTSAGQAEPIAEPLTFTHKMPLSDRDQLAELGAVAYVPLGGGRSSGRQVLASSGWGASAGTMNSGIRVSPAGGAPIEHSAYTIALWLMPGGTAGERHVLSLTNDEGPLMRFSNQLSLASDGRLRHYTFSIANKDQPQNELTGTVGLMQYSRTKLPRNTWTHVVATASANGQMRLYFNGQPSAQPVTIPQNLQVGTHYALGGAAQTRTDPPEIARKDLKPYRGGIESLALFDRQLSDKEVQELYDTAKQARQTTATAKGND